MWMQTIFTFLVGMVVGGGLVGTGVWYVLSFFFHDPDDKKRLKSGTDQIPVLPSSATFQLPPVLLSKISDESCKAKESCWAVNFILYFLFRELKNSEGVRRWILRKLALEFDELLATSVLGKFLNQITIQNIDLGQNFPVVNWLRTTKVELHPVFKSISTLDILVDLDYSGGFQFSIKAESHLTTSAFLSIQFNAVKGQARLQFVSEPYAHWSFSFVDSPEIDIDVKSQLYGKSFSHVTNVIAAQLKKSVRKKHTLPMYKIRYKPFFNRIQPLVAACVPNAVGTRSEPTGTLTITVVECRGLMASLCRGNVFASLGLASFDWVAVYESAGGQLYVVRDIGYVKTANREVKFDFRLVQQGDVPVVESVESPISIPRAIQNVMNMVSFSPTSCVFQPGDEIIAVDGKRVSTIKQCFKHFRNSTAVRVLFRIRRRCSPGEGDGVETVEEGIEATDGLGLGGLPGSSLHSDGSQSQNSSRRNSFTAESPVDTYSSVVRTVPKVGDKVGRIYKTVQLPGFRDPIFQESFVFTLAETQQYINIGCWSSEGGSSSEGSATSSTTGSPIKKSKGTRPSTPTLPFGRDTLLGTVSIPVGDVVSECLTTGMGFFAKDFYFGPPDGLGASDAKELGLKTHSGFEPTMCYGKVTLTFHFKSSEDCKRKPSVDTGPTSVTVVPLDLATGDMVLDQSQLSPGDEPQRRHNFVRTQFKSSASCDFCNKKIWLKEAYVCSQCNMRCHKKCIERCTTLTICSREFDQERRRRQNPEIITTESEPLRNEINRNGETGPTLTTETARNQQPTGSGSLNFVRRRIASAVHGRSAQLKRVGSATTLLPPGPTGFNGLAGTRSLPPSPEVSPGSSRKTSEATPCGTLFLSLDPTGSGHLTREALDATIHNLIQYKGEDSTVIAKSTGRDLYANQELNERQDKLRTMLSRLEEEMEDLVCSSEQKMDCAQKSAQVERKESAVMLMILHVCAGLQNVQELRDAESRSSSREAESRSSSPDSMDLDHDPVEHDSEFQRGE